MDVELNCTIDDKTILDKFKNIDLVLTITTKYNKEYKDEYLLFYPLNDEIEINIDSEYVEPNILYSNSNIQMFFNKNNPYYYHIGKTHDSNKTILIDCDNRLFNLFNEVLIVKGYVKKDNEDNIVVTEDMRDAINNSVVMFDVESDGDDYSKISCVELLDADYISGML